MTETRGRALIISNHFNGTRAGSEHDYCNMERMLQKFGFVIAGAHRNYTAEVCKNYVFVCVTTVNHL